MSQGKFITLEGIDGAGKSTQLAWIADFLQRRGVNVVVTREPGGTQLGEKIRAILLDTRLTMHPETEVLLMFAARREHLDKVIFPALARGDWVVSDRFTDASFAYQGGGRQVNSTKLENLEQWAQGVFQPDLTLYFDVSVALGQQRTASIKQADRFEQEQTEFFQRTRAAYLTRVEKYPERIHLIDASRPLQKVHEAVRDTLGILFSQK
jgi:dTMP kinase